MKRTDLNQAWNWLKNWNVPIAVVSNQGKLLRLNDLARSLPLNSENLLSDVIDLIDRKTVSDHLKNGSESQFECSVSFVSSNGKFRKRLQAVRFDCDVTFYWVILVIDSGHDSSSELLNLKRAIDQTSIVAVIDDDGNFLDVNEKLCEVFLYRRDELVGKSHQVLNSEVHSIEFYSEMWKVLKRGEVWRGEVQGRSKSGTMFWHETVIVPTHSDRGAPTQFTCIQNDITQKKKNESERAVLLARELAALEASRLKSAFLANMSHEIRTPLHGVLGMAKLLSGTSLSDDQKELTNTILQSAQSLLSILNDILDFSKIEAGKLEIEETDFDFRKIAEDVSNGVKASAQDKNIRFKTSIRRGFHSHFRGDPTRIRQIILNLCQNAIKFTEKGFVALRIRQDITTISDRTWVLIEVKDTGIGVDGQSQERLFDAFVQADLSTTRKFGGSGLGLSICKRLAEMMGGKIGVRSVPGKGSTFWVKLPLHPISAPSLLQQDVLRVISVRPSPVIKKKVLVVDDNEINQKVILRMLQNLGHDAEACDGGKRALERIAKDRFDLIFMDCHMPEMDGFETTRKIRLRENGVFTPIVALTADVMKGTREKCLESGMNDYIQKPVEIEVISEVLSRDYFSRKESELKSAPKSQGASEVVLDLGVIQRLRLMNTPGEPDIVEELVMDFRRKVPKSRLALLNAVSHQDSSKLENEAHSLKSVAALLGAQRLAAVCRELERIGREASGSDWVTQAQDQIHIWDQAIRELEPELSRAVIKVA